VLVAGDVVRFVRWGEWELGYRLSLLRGYRQRRDNRGRITFG
jgi:hypothetical protein